MQVHERSNGDVAELRKLMSKEKVAQQRDRYRVVLLAIAGHEANEIAAMTGRARRFVQRWAYAYRDAGIAGIKTKPRPGRVPFLTDMQRDAVAKRIRVGPVAADKVTVLRGKDLQRWIDSQFGKFYSLSGIYKLLHSMNFELLSPRPRHPLQNPKKIKQFKKSAPLLSSE